VEYLTARVLGRAFHEPRDFDGDETVAVEAQLRRYETQAGGSRPHDRVRAFVEAEMAGLSQELTSEVGHVTARFFSSEEQRRVLGARVDDPAAVALLVELARGLIMSPVPPRLGVDLVFFEPGTTPPQDTTVVDHPCGRERAAPCTASVLATEAGRLRMLLDTPPSGV
jgi:hypothetical protein